PRPESEYYDERLAKQYTEYDPDLANEYLDRAGYRQRDSDGFRLRPDGKRISFTLELPGSGFDPTYPETANLVAQYFEKVGVQMRVQPQGGPLFWERLFANEHDAVMYSAENGL